MYYNSITVSIHIIELKMPFLSFFRNNSAYTKLVEGDDTLKQIHQGVDFLKCEQKAVLSVKDARETLDVSPIKSSFGFNKIPVLLDRIKMIVVEEIGFRNTNTAGSLTFERKVLDDLMKQFNTFSESNNDEYNQIDIKELIRKSLDNQELKAANESTGQGYLWDDIRKSLNEKIGFQPELMRNPDIVALVTKSGKINQDRTASAAAGLNFKDPNAFENTTARIRGYEEAVATCVQQQLSKTTGDESSKEGNHTLRI